LRRFFDKKSCFLGFFRHILAFLVIFWRFLAFFGRFLLILETFYAF